MSEKTSRILQWLLYALLAISAVLGALFYMDFEKADQLIYWGYVLLIMATVITLIASVFTLFVNPKGAIKFLITFGIMVVLGIIAYSLSSNQFTEIQLQQLKTTAGTVKLVGAGLIFTYILAAVAVLAIIVSSVSKIFK